MFRLANTVQTKKRIRQNEKKNQLQQGQITKIRTAKKRFEKAVENGDDNVEELFNKAVKQIDKGVSKNHIHENKAARDKSRLHKMLNK